MPPSTKEDNSSRGFVSLVGAGPGDPELVTVRALDRIRNCQAVVYDRLIPAQLLEEVPPSAERIDVGKLPGKARVPQEEIHTILIEKARKGLRVVRLKGGDPGIFGRVGEEIEALQDANIPFEIVPGVTAGIAAAAAAGIPLTHRQVASSVTLVTGHEDPLRENSHLDWEEMARAGTLVFYMVGQHLSEIGDRLIQSGRSEGTPVSIVREASHPTESITQTTLGQLKLNSETFRPGFPAVLIVGEVVATRNQGRSRPLEGKRIVLTHPVDPNDLLRGQLAQAGARIFLCPSIQIDPVEDSSELEEKLARLADYDWILFTSKNAVRAIRGIFDSNDWDARHFGRIKIASVGSSTSRHLKDWGIRADLVPPLYTAEGLASMLREQQEIRGRKFLFPCSEIARKDLETAIREEGGSLDRVTAYRTVTSKQPWVPSDLPSTPSVDGICFTSSSTVQGFFERAGEETFIRILRSARVYSIGSKTTRTLQELGAEGVHESEVSDFQGMTDLILQTERALAE